MGFVTFLCSLSLTLYLVNMYRNFFKEATLEGGLSLVRGFGMGLFEVAEKDRNLANTFNQSMSNHTTIVMKKILEIYKGFEGLSQVVDVGGGLGTNLKLIVSKYPQIKGINFDLPPVVKDAPNFPGNPRIDSSLLIISPRKLGRKMEISLLSLSSLNLITFGTLFLMLGVEHVGGDMFTKVPHGEVIFMKVSYES